MSARFELETSGPRQTEIRPFEQFLQQINGLNAEYKFPQISTADKHLPASNVDETGSINCGKCSVDSTGKAVNERQDFHDARERLRKGYEEKFRHGEPVKLEYGATIWDVAEARLTVEKGHKPTAQDITKESAKILKEIGCGPCDDIKGKIVKSKKEISCEPTGGAACEVPPVAHEMPKRKNETTRPGSPDTPTISKEHGEAAIACSNEHKSHHGRVEKHDNYTVIKEDNGATETIRTDDKGAPIEVTRQGGHWGKKEHFTKTGEHEWTDDNHRKFHGDVNLSKDGTYSYTDSSNGFTKVYKPDGSRYDQTADGQKTFIQTPDGSHQHSYLRGHDGKWQESPGGEKFNDVQITGDGTVIAKGQGIIKVMRPDGSQIDTTLHGERTYILTPDGPNQTAYELNKATGRWHEKGTDKKYSYVSMDENGVVTAKDKQP